jgi:ATP/maltotriose-dependent transcriptional regulator MalT
MILQHQGIPYLLCDNGNLWLSLSSVTVSTQKRSGNATITHTETGEHYVFADGRYVLSDALAVTQDELLLLELMCNDLSMDRIMSQLKIPKSSFHLKKQRLFEKLDVKNVGGAVYKAGLMGLI